MTASCKSNVFTYRKWYTHPSVTPTHFQVLELDSHRLPLIPRLRSVGLDLDLPVLTNAIHPIDLTERHLLPVPEHLVHPQAVSHVVLLPLDADRRPVGLGLDDGVDAPVRVVISGDDAYAGHAEILLDAGLDPLGRRVSLEGGGGRIGGEEGEEDAGLLVELFGLDVEGDGGGEELGEGFGGDGVAARGGWCCEEMLVELNGQKMGCVNGETDS